MKPETREWVDMSDVDLQTAQATLERDLYAPCVFHSQQAVEKMLKAVWVERGHKDPPPYTHNLVDLAQELGLLSADWEDFLRSLSNQAIASRYAGRDTYDRAMALQYYERSLGLCGQLRQTMR
ncbi:MAG: HEPN domain-containing protein [Dehalococcoidia bacterium]